MNKSKLKWFIMNNWDPVLDYLFRLKKQSHSMPAISQCSHCELSHGWHAVKKLFQTDNSIYFFLKRISFIVICFHKIFLSCSWKSRWYHFSWEHIASVSIKKRERAVVSHPTGDSSHSDRRQSMGNFSQYILCTAYPDLRTCENGGKWDSHSTNFLLRTVSYLRSARRKLKVRCSTLDIGGN